jgi:hypothetical protein
MGSAQLAEARVVLHVPALRCGGQLHSLESVLVLGSD